ncbi:copper homeostasis protein CutC [Chelonobacter oris]|uniref:copper homeostasis protein CutC n=1 Tax=Chelonobacter oris TaxID=505317 RepID=UPI002A3442D1|nr:copper homeostasis protein CutC [Chelonobacter oris]
MNIEVCIDNIESLKTAQRSGASRIELCAALALGGITPHYGLIERAVSAAERPIYVMIRPRAGDFLFSRDEINIMQADIRMAKQLGVDGIVIGALTAQAEVDLDCCRHLIESADGLGITFHRAFDLCRDPLFALEQIVELGCERILTSGQQQSAVLGMPLIRRLVQQAKQRISIMPGAGVNRFNALRILQQTGATELHLSAKGYRRSRMQSQHNPTMGQNAVDDLQINVTDESELSAVVQAVRQAF